MSSEDNKALVRRFWEEVFNQRRLERADALVAQTTWTMLPCLGKGPGWQAQSSSDGRCTLPPSPICM